ncbi:MAG: MFS transporter [Gammaproteobacteria bacterium]
MNDTPRGKPELSVGQIWNMCFGFLGIQFGFALQNANVSRIFQTLGAEIDDLPILWLAGPVTGLLVQPVIGYFSDRTWGPLGRRRPYFLWGAVLASAALIVMPNSPTLWVAAGLLWILDASINVSMEPFRALVGDMLPERQRALGYSMQSLFIGLGAVVASALPWVFTNWFGFANTAPDGEIPASVEWSFYFGAAAFLGAVLWSVLRTREYPPDQLQAFEVAEATEAAARGAAPTVDIPDDRPTRSAVQYRSGALLCLVVGAAFCAAIATLGWRKELYVLAGGLVAFGRLSGHIGRRQAAGRTDGMLHAIVNDLFGMPRVMRQLAVVQMLTWFALFAMWIYTTAAVARHQFGATDPDSPAFQEGANWVGILFAAYNVFAVVWALALPWLARRIGRRGAHLVSLVAGGLGLASFALIHDPQWLLLSMAGVGIAWASIVSLPYAMLVGSLPARKLGLYVGIFNFFIVIPQILAASLLGLMVDRVFGDDPLWALVLGGGLMVAAGIATLRVDD